MAFIKKTARTLRNNWKKSTFAACVVTYGVNWIKEKFDIDELMRVYCEEALRYGEVAISGTVSPRSITVILNPTANKRKAVDDFESYCAPILNLAGILVDVIHTQSEGHAKEVVQGISTTDAVVVAGGDGTLSEVITGLLRRTGESNGDLVPVGVLPLGIHNTLSASLFPGGKKLAKVKSLADASIAIVQEVTRPIDVMKIEIIDDGEEQKKPVYALSGLEWGAYRDAGAKRDKYWYFGPLRKYATYVFNGYKNSLCWNIDATINYSLPCEGCANCIIKQPDLHGKKWYHKLFITQQPKQSTNVVNDVCTATQELTVCTSDLELITSNVTAKHQGPPKLHLKVGPSPDRINYFGFVKDGWNTENGKTRTILEQIEARQVVIRPLQPPEVEMWFSIDREDFEVKPVKITLLPKLINMFCKKDAM